MVRVSCAARCRKRKCFLWRRNTRVAYLPTSCQRFPNCVRPGENFFIAFACKFDTSILAVGSCSVFDEFTCRFSRTSVCRGGFFFLSLSLPFSSMVIERSFDGRICRWRAAIIHLQCRRELWLQSFFGKSVQPVAKLARYNKRRIESTNLWLKMLTFFD